MGPLKKKEVCYFVNRLLHLSQKGHVWIHPRENKVHSIKMMDHLLTGAVLRAELLHFSRFSPPFSLFPVSSTRRPWKPSRAVVF